MACSANVNQEDSGMIDGKLKQNLSGKCWNDGIYSCHSISFSKLIKRHVSPKKLVPPRKNQWIVKVENGISS